VVSGWEAQLPRQNLLRSWLAASLSVVVAVAAGLLTVRPGAVGAAERWGFEIFVNDAGFSPPVVSDVNVGDVLIFKLYKTTNNHTVTFEDNSVCPGNPGAVPCWPELRFYEDQPGQSCDNGRFVVPGWRCMIVQEPGKTVRYHDAKNPANGGEIRVLGQPTTTTGPGTPTTTAPTATTTTLPSTTTTTWSQSTTTSAPTAIRPFVIPDPPPTTSTMAPPASMVTNKGGTTAPTANKDKGKDNGKAKPKAAGTETPTTASLTPPDAMPPDSVFDPAALTPGPVLVPDTPGNADGRDEVDLESAAVMNLLDHDEATDQRPLLLALAALAFLLTVGGLWHWLHRASRYDPA
jgi:hypothetical protein